MDRALQAKRLGRAGQKYFVIAAEHPHATVTSATNISYSLNNEEVGRGEIHLLSAKLKRFQSQSVFDAALVRYPKLGQRLLEFSEASDT
jgi:hypothetical protein